MYCRLVYRGPTSNTCPRTISAFGLELAALAASAIVTKHKHRAQITRLVTARTTACTLTIYINYLVCPRTIIRIPLSPAYHFVLFTCCAVQRHSRPLGRGTKKWIRFNQTKWHDWGDFIYNYINGLDASPFSQLSFYYVIPSSSHSRLILKLAKK